MIGRRLQNINKPIKNVSNLLKSVDCFQNREVTLQHLGPDFLNLTSQEFQTKCPEEISVVGNTSMEQLGEILCTEFSDLGWLFLPTTFQC